MCDFSLSHPTHSISLEIQIFRVVLWDCRTQVGVGEEEEELLCSVCPLCPWLGHIWPLGLLPSALRMPYLSITLSPLAASVLITHLCICF